MRYEKVGRSKENFVEILLDGARVFLAKGARNKGDVEWTSKDSDIRTYGFGGDAEKAKAFYEERVGGLAKEKFVSVGDAMPIIAAQRAKGDADAAQNESGRVLSALSKPEADVAALVERGKAIVVRWQTALAAMNPTLAEQTRSLYGDRIARLERELSRSR